MLIKALNNLDTMASFSYLSNGESAGAGTLRVKNISPYYSNWAVQVGATGEETSEILLITSGAVSGTSIVVTGTAKFDHPVDVPVYATKYNQVIFKRSTAGTAGTATALTGGTITITPDSQFTIFDDTTGAVTYAYKTQYYNSASGDVSSESDWITPAGPSFYSLQKMRDRVKAKLNGNQVLKDETVINDWLNEWLERMTNVAIDVNEDYSIGTVDVGFGTSGLGTITASDYKDIRRFWVTYDGNGYVRATRIKVNEFDPNDIFSTMRPAFYFQGDNIFGVKPDSQAGTARLVYYKTSPVMVDDGDLLPVSMRNYTKSFVDYALSQFYYFDNRPEFGDPFKASAEGDLERFRQEITPRQKTGPEMISIASSTSGEDGSYLAWEYS